MTYSKASLRIVGQLQIDKLSEEMGIKPTYSHLKGEVGAISTVFDADMWLLDSPLDKRLPLEQHLVWLVDHLEDRHSVLNNVMHYAKVDVFCSITADEQSGFSLSPRALSLFHSLQITMEVSLVLR